MSKISSKAKKLAIVVFNLGGPDSLKSVKPFLFNLFNDKYIINLPVTLRFVVAWIISSIREKLAKEIYLKMGGKSTILEETQNQAKALKEYLNGKLKSEYEIFVCMRHWHPMIPEIIKKLENYSPDEIILLPLYPQFSTTTTASFIDNFSSLKKKSLVKNITCKTICCYPTDNSFIKAYAELVTNAINLFTNKSKNYIVLFSAHGLPHKIVKNGDPYQWQVNASVSSLIKTMDFKDFDYKITYQSRVGPLEWIGPNTEEEIKNAAKNGIDLIIVPISFVSEHSETLVELDIEYKNIADNYGILYHRVQTIRINNHFVKSLGDMIISFEEKEGDFILSSSFSKVCPDEFSKCPCKSTVGSR